MPLELRPSRKPRRHREVARIAGHAREARARIVVMAELHLDLAHRGAEGGVRCVALAEILRDAECVAETMLREERSGERLSRLRVVRAAIVQRPARGALGTKNVLVVAGGARTAHVEERERAERHAAGRIASRDAFVERDVRIEHLRGREARLRGRDRPLLVSSPREHDHRAGGGSDDRDAKCSDPTIPVRHVNLHAPRVPAACSRRGTLGEIMRAEGDTGTRPSDVPDRRRYRCTAAARSCRRPCASDRRGAGRRSP